MRYVFIVNPFAGSGDSEALIREAVNNSKHTGGCHEVCEGIPNR